MHIRNALEKYANIIDPWARSVAHRTVTEVSLRDKNVWLSIARAINKDLVAEIHSAPLADKLAELVEQQVGLIKSIPLEAAAQVQALVMEGLEGGKRIEDVAKHIEGVTKARATLIANTETGRAAANIMQARAEWIGIEQFVWRSMHDAAVRPLHRHLDGHAFRFDDPPVTDERTGAKSLPGAIYNCRCFADPAPFVPHGTKAKPNKIGIYA
jgi:SPP1 gp7 family putative phage head morphogenesis protein